jgi:hypothetical protein
MLQFAAPSAPSAKYHSLLAVLHETQDNRPQVARDVLDLLVDRQLDRESDDDVRYFVFANALAKRISTEPSTSINLYLREYEQPQIELFNLVATHLPTVGAAGAVANRMLARHLGGRASVTLLDIGIGTARQEVALLHEMARAGTLPGRLTVVAVEPNEYCLATAERALREAADALGLELRFRGIGAVIEDLSPAQWAELRADADPLVVHAAFATHHIREGQGGGRDAVFGRLKSLDPEAIVLCEPSADHHNRSFMRRFESAWDHFSRTFHLIDQLDVAPRDRRAMKLFFTREIEDILTNDEAQRCERHEPVSAWVDRLKGGGMTGARDHGDAARVPTSHITTSTHDGWVGLDFGGVTLVAIICAVRTPSDVAVALPFGVEPGRRVSAGSIPRHVSD